MYMIFVSNGYIIKLIKTECPGFKRVSVLSEPTVVKLWIVEIL